jgi:hypothetical protein
MSVALVVVITVILIVAAAAAAMVVVVVLPDLGWAEAPPPARQRRPAACNSRLEQSIC